MKISNSMWKNKSYIRNMIGIMLIVVPSIFITSCTENTDSKNKVEFWDVQAHLKAREPMAQEYEKLNPGMHIEYSGYSTDGIKDALKVGASSGSLPDSWFTWGGSLGSFYPLNGLTVDLSQRAREENWDQIYIPAMLELSTFGGMLSGIPTQAYSMGVFYKKKFFEQFNLEEPKSFSEFENILEVLKSNDITPISTAGRNGWMLMRLVEGLIEESTGRDLHDRLNKLEASWNSSKVVAAYRKLREWVDAGYFNDGFLTIPPEEVRLLLFSDKAAMAIEGPWFDDQLTEKQQPIEDYGFFPFPVDSSNQAPRLSSFVEMYQFNKESPSEKFEHAIGFVKWATSKDIIEQYKDVIPFPSATQGVPMPLGIPHTKEIIDAVKKGGSYLVTDQALPQEVIQKFFQAQDEIVAGSKTPEEAASLIQEEIEKYKGKQ